MAARTKQSKAAGAQKFMGHYKTSVHCWELLEYKKTCYSH